MQATTAERDSTGTGGPPMGGIGAYVPSAREQAKDRKRAAIHEAGHMVAAFAFHRNDRVTIRGRIWPVDASSEREMSWLGEYECFGCSNKRKRLQPKTVAARSRIIAVAGSVAEYIYRYRWVPDFDSCTGLMSDSDWALAGCEPARGHPNDDCLHAIHKASILLRYDGPLWGNVLTMARRLIVIARASQNNVVHGPTCRMAGFARACRTFEV
jgi:hypothetical protein